MGPQETKAMQKVVDELLSTKLIRVSLSPCDVTAILVPKKDDSRRLCVDSRAINKIIVKY